MKEYDLFAFGNLSIDFIKTPDDKQEMTGGAILYGVWVAYKLNYKVGILTKISDNERNRLDAFPIPKEDIYILPSKETTSILNEYTSRDMETRICTGLSEADPFSIEDFPEFKAKVVQYSGLIQGEIDRSIIKYLADKGKLAIDAQGLLRKVNEDKSMNFNEFKGLEDVMDKIYYFKADAAEAQFITGIDTSTQEGRIKAGKVFLQWGAKEIIISHNKALTLISEDEIVSFPFKNRSLIGRTGRGDTSFTAYILERINKSKKDALLFATALTSLKMEEPGPFKKERKDVEEFIEKYYKEFLKN